MILYAAGPINNCKVLGLLVVMSLSYDKAIYETIGKQGGVASLHVVLVSAFNGQLNHFKSVH